MIKASQQQTPHADNPPANWAVSVILIRDSARGLEAFVQHRASTMDFAAGAVAFPGGRVDSIDSSGWYFDHEILAAHAAAWAASKISEPPSLSLLNVGRLMAAARREVEEECGISLDQSALKPWANWITPEGLPKRFDTYFYVSAVADGLEPIHQTTEASASLWIPVVELLEKQEAGLLKVLPPTLSVLDELDELGTVARVLELKRSIVPVRLRSDGIEEFYALRRQRRQMSGHM